MFFRNFHLKFPTKMYILDGAQKFSNILFESPVTGSFYATHTHTKLIQSFVCFGWQLLVKFRPTNWMLDLLSLSFDDDDDDNNSATTSTIIWTHHTNPDTVHIRNQSVK